MTGNAAGQLLRQIADAKVEKARLWRLQQCAKGKLGEHLGERWLRDARRMEVDPWDQTRGTRLDTAPIGGKRPDFLTEIDDEAIVADAKMRTLDEDRVFAVTETELAQYRATMTHYKITHLVFLVIPLAPPLRLITVHIDQLDLPTQIDGKPALGVALDGAFDPYTYELPSTWWDEGIAKLRSDGFAAEEVPVLRG